MQIEEYRSCLEQFDIALNRELYGYFSGSKDQLETRRIYSEHSDLFTLGIINAIAGEHDRAADSLSSKRKSLHRLRWFAIEHHLDSRISGLAEEICRYEAHSTIQWDGAQVSFVKIPYLLNQESSREARQSLNEARISVIKGTESLRLEWLARLNSAAANLGYGSYLEILQSCTKTDYRAVAELFDKLVRGTEGLYRDRLCHSLQATIGRAADEARHCDAWYWRRKNETWSSLTRGHLLDSVAETCCRLGLQPVGRGRITLDFEDRPLKRPRPFCIPVRVPDEIYVVLLPRGGYSDYAALLHESGHAHHFAWTSPSLAVEFRIFGDRGLCETYAFLFEYLLTDREWLRETFGVSPSESLLRFQHLFRSFLIRRNAGKLRNAISLFQGSLPDDAPAEYAESMRRYTGFEHDPELYLEDLTEGFCQADYLRAWILQAMLRNRLRSRFGNAWYRDRAAGSFLKEIWETGMLYSADELSREMGLGPLDGEALQDEITEDLRQ